MGSFNSRVEIKVKNLVNTFLDRRAAKIAAHRSKGGGGEVEGEGGEARGVGGGGEEGGVGGGGEERVLGGGAEAGGVGGGEGP